MLYREEWSIPKAKPSIQPDVFSLDGLIGWLETKLADKKYCYLSHGHCLIAKYLTAMGFKKVVVYSYGFFEHAENDHDHYPNSFDFIAAEGPRTFGAALERARKARSALSADGSARAALQQSGEHQS